MPAIILSGLPLGIGNSLLSNLLFGVSHTDPADAAAATTNFIRFTGGAISPFLAGKLSEQVSASAPLYVSAAVGGGARVRRWSAPAASGAGRTEVGAAGRGWRARAGGCVTAGWPARASLVPMGVVADGERG